MTETLEEKALRRQKKLERMMNNEPISYAKRCPVCNANQTVRLQYPRTRDAINLRCEACQHRWRIGTRRRR